MTRRLTWRQREVLALIAEGMSGPQIADRLHIQPCTASAHAKAALQRLGAVNRAHAVALAVMSGELTLPTPGSAGTRDHNDGAPFKAWQTTEEA